MNLDNNSYQQSRGSVNHFECNNPVIKWLYPLSIFGLGTLCKHQMVLEQNADIFFCFYVVCINSIVLPGK